MSGPVLGSLCTGYGGLEMGLRQAGWAFRLGFVADTDLAATKVLAHHHPDVPNLGDITAVDWWKVSPVDILTAGFPCQDVSAAGRRNGLLAGNRSGLWYHVATAIDALRPNLVFLENVRGLLSARADSDLEPCPWCVGDDDGEPALRALGAVLGTLADLGYDAAWTSLPAAAVGCCHLRWRVFIAAWPAAHTEEFRHGHPWAPRVGGVPAAPVGGAVRPDGLTLLPTPTARDGMSGPGHAATAEGAPNLRTTLALLPTPRATDGTNGGPNQRGSSGDLMLPSAVMQLLPTPTVADARGTRNATANRTSPPSGVHTNHDGVTLSDVAYAERWGEYAAAIARHEAAFGRPAPDPTEPGAKGQPRLAPAFVEWMMALPAGHVTAVPGISRNDMLRLLGNGIVPAQAAAAVPVLMDLMAAPVDAVREVAA